MRQEAYIFSIYCDNKGLVHEIESWNHFVGKNAGRCKYKARKLGWKLSNKKKDLCPDCHVKWLADRKVSREKKLKELKEKQ